MSDKVQSLKRQPQSPTQRKPPKGHLCYKTKSCLFHLQGRCNRSKDCTFAHGDEEMREVPNLTKTKMCEEWQKNRRCTKEKCDYAHSKKEIRNQPAYKTSMCAVEWNSGSSGVKATGFKCKKLDCPYAHSPDEIRTPLLLSPPSTHEDLPQPASSSRDNSFGHRGRKPAADCAPSSELRRVDNREMFGGSGKRAGNGQRRGRGKNSARHGDKCASYEIGVMDAKEAHQGVISAGRIDRVPESLEAIQSEASRVKRSVSNASTASSDPLRWGSTPFCSPLNVTVEHLASSSGATEAPSFPPTPCMSSHIASAATVCPPTPVVAAVRGSMLCLPEAAMCPPAGTPCYPYSVVGGGGLCLPDAAISPPIYYASSPVAGFQPAFPASPLLRIKALRGELLENETMQPRIYPV